MTLLLTKACKLTCGECCCGWSTCSEQGCVGRDTSDLAGMSGASWRRWGCAEDKLCGVHGAGGDCSAGANGDDWNWASWVGHCWRCTCHADLAQVVHAQLLSRRAEGAWLSRHVGWCLVCNGFTPAIGNTGPSRRNVLY